MSIDSTAMNNLYCINVCVRESVCVCVCVSEREREREREMVEIGGRDGGLQTATIPLKHVIKFFSLASSRKSCKQIKRWG